MGAIVDVHLRQVSKLLEDKDLVLDLSRDAHDWLAREGTQCPFALSMY